MNGTQGTQETQEQGIKTLPTLNEFEAQQQAGAQGTEEKDEKKGQPEPIEFDNITKRLLRAEGIDPDKVSTDPAEQRKATVFFAQRNQQLAEERKAGKAAVESVKNLTLDYNIVGEDGKVDSDKLKAVVRQSQRGASITEAAATLFEKGHISKEVFDLLSEEDPAGIRYAAKFLPELGSGKGDQSNVGIEQQIEDAVSKRLASMGIMSDVSGRQSPASLTAGGALQQPQDYSDPKFTENFMANLGKPSGNGK